MRPLALLSAAPSISQTAATIGTKRAGAKPTGGMASAPTAPAPSAISLRRQPQARMTPRAKAPKGLAVGGIVEAVDANLASRESESGRAT